MNTAYKFAESAGFQAFLNCYLNEFDPGHWFDSQTWQSIHDMHGLFHGSHILELHLSQSQHTIAIDVLYHSASQHHQFGHVWIKTNTDSWSPLSIMNTTLQLISEIYHRHEQQSGDYPLHQQTELMSRLLNSQQNMAEALFFRANDNSLNQDHFIATEQSLLLGHWSHPTPKSRQGIHQWQQTLYSPEYKGRFQLHWFTVNKVCVKQNSLEDISTQQILHRILQHTDNVNLNHDEIIVPCHPLQADKLIHTSLFKQARRNRLIKSLGLIGPEFYPTSSVRTLYHPDLPWMLKLSIPVKITNSERINQEHELRAGLVGTRLIQTTGFCDKHPGFNFIHDPAYLSVNVSGQSLGLETIIRHNPFKRGDDNGIYSIAALTQAPVNTQISTLRRLIEGLALSEGRPVKQVSQDWLAQYWNNAIEPLIRLFDEHGIALEAHQQNSLLDVSSGYPRRYFYRDNQGFYLAKSYRSHLHSLDLELDEAPELFYDEELIQDRFGYYLMLNQLCGLIHRFGNDGLVSETDSLMAMRQRLTDLEQQLSGAGKPFIQRLLSQPTLPCKSNLLTRIHDVDELTAELEQAVYVNVSNPLYLAHTQQENRDVSRSAINRY